MSVQMSELGNGLRVVSHRMDHVETVSIGVWVGTGARHESAAQNGISHFLEHMAFKGTQKRTARAIAEEIENIGGELNAATSLETTAYYARVLKGDDVVALEVLADILQESVFDVDELARERDVIIQEIAGGNDSPDDLVYDLVQDGAFPGQALGRSILGTPDTVRAITSNDLRDFLGARYGPQRMVVSAAGAVDHDELHRHAEALFSGLAGDENDGGRPARYEGGVRASKRPFEQSHLVVGFEGPSFGCETSFSTHVLSGLLGGGMSSRLFQEVRENRGLAYAIYSAAWGLSDTGMFALHAATGSEMMVDLTRVMANELRSLCNDGPREEEVSRAKAQLKSGLMMGLESSAARAEQMARHLINFDRLISAEEIVAKVDAVDVGSVREVSRNLFAGPPCVAVVGSGERAPADAKFAQDEFLAIRG